MSVCSTHTSVSALLSHVTLFPLEAVTKESAVVDKSDFEKRAPPICAMSQILGDIKPYFRESAQSWGARVAKQYLSSNEIPEYDIVDLKFPLSEWLYYSELQNELAKCFPIESDRPTIALSLRNSNLPPQKIIGILGGLGPLADANMVAQVESVFSSNLPPTRSVELRLHSNPHPPRTFWSMSRMSSWSYGWDIWNFMSQKDVSEFVLGSNTAHIQINLLNQLSGYRIFDGVRHVCHVLKNSQHVAARTLVLGTTSAYQHELYPKALRELGLEVVCPSVEEQERVQQAIELIKTGQIQLGRKLLSTVLACLANPPVSHVLLGCTELPLAVDKTLIHEAFGYECEVVDTLEIFSRHIAETL